MKNIVAGQQPVTAAEFAETALGDYYHASVHALRDIRATIAAEGDELDRAALPYYDRLIADYELEQIRLAFYNTLVRKAPLPRREPRRPRRVANHRPKSERRPAAPAVSTRPAVRFVLRGRSA
ncbi:hypothetical protein [Streptomyces chartreusis]|uniref:Uncharacterized protein n=1 Tax=Streptomyces chartreusis TaxID=1969 RepID=A0A7H8TE18_STRCX|nr:hypothetical protein [Streptomyces chartreusis]QKZ20290.1 hypothetical protein HUT05_24820 [Streptomyces chartreusis]